MEAQSTKQIANTKHMPCVYIDLLVVKTEIVMRRERQKGGCLDTHIDTQPMEETVRKNLQQSAKQRGCDE